MRTRSRDRSTRTYSREKEVRDYLSSRSRSQSKQSSYHSGERGSKSRTDNQDATQLGNDLAKQSAESGTLIRFQIPIQKKKGGGDNSQTALIAQTTQQDHQLNKRLRCAEQKFWKKGCPKEKSWNS